MPILNAKHYTAFGAIIHAYASVEFGIKAALAGILEIPYVEVLVITEPYTALSLKNVAKSLVKLSTLKMAHKTSFVNIIGDWGTFSPLRNQIAHCRWQDGSRPDSVRPIGVDIRSGHAKWIVTEGSRDWTLPELAKQAVDLAGINERTKTFHKTADLTEIMERKDAERKAIKEA